MKNLVRGILLAVSIGVLSACGYYDFEKSPFGSASFYVYEKGNAELSFTGVTASGNWVTIDLSEGAVEIIVDISLPKGTALLSGKVSRPGMFSWRLRQATIFVSSKDEQEIWQAQYRTALDGLKKVRAQGPHVPRVVSPPRVYGP